MSNQYHEMTQKIKNSSVESIVAMGVYSADRSLWLEQSINSIFNQTYQNFLFVIVIDGHIDASLRVFLKQLCEQRQNIFLMESERNRGLSCAMNNVVEWMLLNAPEAKYFFRMDSDDISEPERFSKQVKFFEQNSMVSVLGTSLIEINEEGQKVGKRNLPNADHQIKRILPRRCAINHPTVAIRTDVFKAGHRYRPELKNTQDYFLWAELAAAGYKFANLPEPLLEFRRVNDFYKRRGLSKSINEFKARFYTMKVLKRYTLGNIFYAFAVLLLRLMPARIVKLAYKVDRYLLNKRIRHE